MATTVSTYMSHSVKVSRVSFLFGDCELLSTLLVVMFAWKVFMSSLNTLFRNLLSRSRRCSYMANFGAVPRASWSENMAEVWEIS